MGGRKRLQIIFIILVSLIDQSLSGKSESSVSKNVNVSVSIVTEGFKDKKIPVHEIPILVPAKKNITKPEPPPPPPKVKPPPPPEKPKLKAPPIVVVPVPVPVIPKPKPKNITKPDPPPKPKIPVIVLPKIPLPPPPEKKEISLPPPPEKKEKPKPKPPPSIVIVVQKNVTKSHSPPPSHPKLSVIDLTSKIPIPVFFDKEEGHEKEESSEPPSQLMSLATDCPSVFFGHMGPKHLKCLVHAMKVASVQNSGSVASGTQLGLLDVVLQHVNSPLLQAATTSSIFHLPQMLGYKNTVAAKSVPPKVMDGAFCNLKRTLHYPTNQRKPNHGSQVKAEDKFFATSDDDRLGYFRKDYLNNWNHFIWHRYYLFSGATFRDDRRGELFYFYHRDMLIRYNANRLTNGLPSATPLDMSAVIARSKALNVTKGSGGDMPPWWSTSSIPSLNQKPDFETMENRLEEAIEMRSLKLPGNKGRVDMNETHGVEMLVDVMEASQWTVNPEYYGSFGVHNAGHMIITFSSPDGEEFPFWKMMTTATSLAEPIFYAYHGAVSHLINQLKDTFEPHQPTQGRFPLVWDKVEIDSIRTKSGKDSNTLWTYETEPPLDPCADVPYIWDNKNHSKSDFHLDHEPFSYEIALTATEETKGTVRIYLAPRFDHSGERFSIADQSKLFFTMDVFTVYLKEGRNVITRRSNESSISIEWPQTTEGLKGQLFCQPEKNGKKVCKCGWPKNLILPKGASKEEAGNDSNEKSTGVFDLFAMVTNGEEDSDIDLGGKDTAGFVYCGLPGHLYPDKKPMGYPFDRLPYNHISEDDEPEGGYLENFVEGIDNMISVQVNIFHKGPKRTTTKKG